MTAVHAPTWSGPVDLPLLGEPDVQAACGLMHVHGRHLGRPAPLGMDYARAVAAELSAIGEFAVELGRTRGVPLAGCTTSVAQAALLSISQYLAAATADEPDEWLPGAGPPFRSSDGAVFEVEALDPGPWSRFWAALDVPARAVERGWRPFLHRFATATCPLPNDFADAAARTPFSALETTARQAGMTVVVRSGRVLDSLPAYRISPRGPDWSTSAEVAPDGELPLSGIVVLESCRRVQGPLVGHLLGLLGATVVRIEPPGGDPLRWVPPMAGDTSARFLALNRGKSVVEIDLRTGRDEVLDLAAAADVFVHNWAPGKAVRWGLRAEDFPSGLVYAHASGWGDELGPEPPLGTDFVVQAHAGVPASLMTVVDVFGGVVATHAVVDALLRRERSGRGQSVASSLLSAASRLNALTRHHDTSAPTVPVCTDLAALARDPRFARALIRDRCALPASPWEFFR
ncbi:CoA transferase [Umezawaea endophytica]|uniref:CoA transferase n=1 Tax=Umezawaea endophytica TaxID=1654476 RepID=A0A9X3A137_9PSEU|nr:CoA transferase [Umezawaea endophytica]MCS7479189.1 CoA transferase [Umezawaea endophytica]